MWEWQLSWLLGKLPEGFWSLILVVGAVGILISWVLKFIPFVNTYRLPIQVGSILLLLTGVYFHGYMSSEAKHRHEQQKIVEELDKKKNEVEVVTNDLSKEIADKKKMQEEKDKRILELINQLKKKNTPTGQPATPSVPPERVETIIKYIRECPVPKEIIDIHNEAAKRN